MRHLVILLALALPATAAEPGPLVRLGSDRFRQPDRVTAVAYSADGKRLATAGDGRVHVWDAADGRLLQAVPVTEREFVCALRFSADGRSLYAAAVTQDKGVTFSHLDPAGGKRVATAVVAPNDRQRLLEPEVRFSPDGSRLAVFAEDGSRLRVIDTATRKEVWAEKSADGRIFSLRFRPDGQALAVGMEHGRVRVIDLAAGKVAHEYAVEGGIIWNMAFSPDGKDLVAEVSNPVPNHVVRFEATTGKVRWTYEAASAKELAFTADGKAVRYWGTDADQKEMYRWRQLDAATGKPVGRLLDTGSGNEVDVRPDGKVTAVGGFYGHVSQWDLETGKRLDAVSADPGVPVTELAFAADGTKVRGWAHGWYEWDVKTGTQTRLSPAFDIGASETAVASLDARWLVHGSDIFVLAEVGKNQNQRTIGVGGDDFRFSRTNRLIHRRDNSLQIYDPSDAKAWKPFLWEPLLHIEAKKGAVAASADGASAIAVVPADDRLHGTRYDLATGKVIGEWDGRLADPAMMDRSHGWRAELSPDGRVVAVFFTYLAHPGMGFNRIEELHTALFDARTGRYRAGWWDLMFPADIAFSPDGRAVACFYGSGLGVEVREVATGERRVRRPAAPIHSAAFGPDGRTLALATGPGPVALWDLVGDPAGKWGDEKPGNLWDGLASDNAELAFDVIRFLRQHPTEAVPFLKERMKVPTAPAADWVVGRIKELDAAQFRDREKATADLAGAGELVVPELRAALKAAAPEARRRLEGLLERAESPSREAWRAARACEALEGIGTPAARELLAAWAKGPPAATLSREAAESLERLGKRRP
jgi:WD40 repeat protein